VNQGPARGLPPRISLPLTLLATALLVAIVFYFIKSSLTVTGAAFGPTAKTNGDSAMTVGGGSAGVAVEGAPPAPIQRMLTEFKTRLAHDPNDRTALLGLAEMYAQAGKYGAALPYYRRVLARQPLDASTRLAYAEALRLDGDDRGALTEIERALSTRPRDAAALFAEGDVAAELGRRSEAIAAYRRALSSTPSGPRADRAREALQSLGA
jgi:cytochrome c-type biogenesis protein CcmH/NrfG